MLAKTRSFIVWSLLLSADCSTAALIVEAWVRLFVPVKNIEWVVDPRLGVRFRPHQRTYGHVEPGYSNILETNGLGLHDIERQVAKKPGVLRIQLYGDSMTAGAQVATDDTISRLLERDMNGRGQPAKVEVMNMASGDDGTAPQILTYQQIGRTYRPDVVVCMFMDDFADNVIELHERTYSPYYRLTSDGGLLLVPPGKKDRSRALEGVKERVLLARVLSNKLYESKIYNDLVRLRRKLTAPATSGANYDSWRRTVARTKALPLTLEEVRHFDNVVRSDQATFILVDGETFNDRDVGTFFRNSDLEDFCVSHSIHYVRLYDVCDELQSSRETALNDRHLNARGNQILTSALAARLERFLGQ